MDWYYATGQQRNGPVPETQLAALIAAGTIKPDTLVWNAQLPAWQPAGTTALFANQPPALAGAGGETQRCIITGKFFPPSQMLQTEHGWVSGEARDTYFQCLREGVPFPSATGVFNARADGKRIVVPAQGARLPLRCVKTNEPVTEEQAKRKKLWWCPPLVFLAILLNILILLILYFIFRKPVEVDIPLSAAGRRVLRKHVLISFGVIVPGLALVVIGGVESDSLAALMILGAIVVLGGLVYASIKTPALRVTKLKDGEAWLAGACPEFLASLPAYRK